MALIAAASTGVAEIDLAAVRMNCDELIRRIGGRRKLIAVLKADAYGHGVEAVAGALADRPIAYVAVGSVVDAIAVRRVSPARVVLLGALAREAAAAIVRHGIIPTVEDATCLESLAGVAGDRRIDVFVKVDCGFGRFGVAFDRAAAFICEVAAHPAMRLAGVYTHLPFSDAAGRAWSRRQSAAFTRMIGSLRRQGVDIPFSQVMASPGVASRVRDDHAGVAAGHLLFGLAPFDDQVLGSAAGFKPALRRIRTALVHVGPRPSAVAAAPYLRDSAGPLGVIPIGISHGFRPRRRSAHVLVGGHRARVLRPCLESTVLDLAAVPQPRRGMPVVILGEDGGREITLAQLCAWHGTSQLALLTALLRALQREYT